MKRLITLLLFSVLVGGASTAAAQKIKIGFLPLNSHTAFYAAELGLYKKYGLDVDIALFQNGPLMVQALLGGDLVAGDFSITVMLNLASQGLPLYFLNSDGIQDPDFPAAAILVRPDDTSISSFKDLKGKTVAQLAVGTLIEMRLLSAAEKYGIPRDSLKGVDAPFGQMGTLLSSKQVDAVYTWPPFDTLISKAGQGRVLVYDTDWAPVAVSSGLAISQQWADKNPETVKLLVKSWIEAGRWINDNPEKARAVAARYLKLPADIAKEMRMLYWPRNGYQLMPSIWDQYYLMLKTKQLKPAKNPQEMMDKYWVKPAERWITPAAKELGIQPDPQIVKDLRIPLPNLEGSNERYLGPWER